MSKYEPIVPEDISSDSFEYHGANIKVVTDSTYSGREGYFPPYNAFRTDTWAVTSTAAPPHYIGIESDKVLICDRYDFFVSWDLVAMTIKDFAIQCSMDGESWNDVYSGTIPSTSTYSQECEFDPTLCKHIRLAVLSTYDTRGYKWAQVQKCKIYGTLANVGMLYTNPDAYGIRKKDTL
jgi:hypothetical protein